MFKNMFDELKEVKYFKEFQGSYNVKHLKEMKRLESLRKADPHVEPRRISTMELFCEYT